MTKQPLKASTLFQQFFAEFHNLSVTNSHWKNGFFLDYKKPHSISMPTGHGIALTPAENHGNGATAK